MSVLIKGMALPPNCARCELFHDEGFCIVTGTSINLWGESRNTDCPLIEVPDHGDLIDRDAIRTDWKFSDSCNRCERVQYQCHYHEEMSIMDVCGMLDDAPAVIPAERSEDGET